MSFYLSWWSRWRGTHRGRCCRPVCWSDRWFCLEWWWMRFQTSAHISKIMSMCISLMIHKRYLSIFWSPLLGIDTYKVDCSFGQFHYNSCSIWYLHHFQVNETVLINHIRPWELCQHYFSDCRSTLAYRWAQSYKHEPEHESDMDLDVTYINTFWKCYLESNLN